MYPGTVSIVGAGPGDPELLTVKAHRLLREADVVFHDSLVGDAILDELPETVAVRNVGKRPGGERTTQDEINRRLVTAARKGETVVRLKGGDPTVFGRGGEEAEFLAAHEVPFQFVPGVSSAVAAPQAAGIPLTHRDHASSVTVITGHEDPTKDESALDWDALARTLVSGGTLVILMGVRRLPDIVRALRDRDVSPETPAATIERATWEDEDIVTGTLDTVVDAVREAGVEPPAVTVVGDVVRVADAVDGPVGAAPASRWRAAGPLLEAVGSEVNRER